MLALKLNALRSADWAEMHRQLDAAGNEVFVTYQTFPDEGSFSRGEVVQNRALAWYIAESLASFGTSVRCVLDPEAGIDGIITVQMTVADATEFAVQAEAFARSLDPDDWDNWALTTSEAVDWAEDVLSPAFPEMEKAYRKAEMDARR